MQAEAYCKYKKETVKKLKAPKLASSLRDPSQAAPIPLVEIVD